MSVTHAPTTPHADPAVAQFLTELYGTAETGWLTLFAINAATGESHVDWAPAADPATLASVAARRAATCDVWYGIATRGEKLEGKRRGGDRDCAALPGMWVDIDIAGPNHKTNEALPPNEEAALDLLWSFHLPATAIVHTGGGLHAYWLFNELRPVADLADMLPRWGATWRRLADARGWHIDNVWDPARVLRLPGTWNRKGDPTPVRVVERWLR